ncbi:hypothetical protein AKJ09_03530 [Labilithrix luteola]|uniref:Uncharacterized protein n=1 Tax=Labilithrix luteola TaxID=1391654 RepID=A0A0K1PU27_9BACT|nr:hypothetical protein [Labilithrix luteola]AKU96866.1 hypothetical protein AKJ09_03530 [Labilithrix luteola]
MMTAFCTADYGKFTDLPIDVVVKEGDKVLSSTSIQRVGCKLSESRGSLENNIVTLRDDGTIAAKFGEDPDTATGCSDDDSLCPVDDL